jgi:hypothetical protein
MNTQRGLKVMLGVLSLTSVISVLKLGEHDQRPNAPVRLARVNEARLSGLQRETQAQQEEVQGLMADARSLSVLVAARRQVVSPPAQRNPQRVVVANRRSPVPRVIAPQSQSSAPPRDQEVTEVRYPFYFSPTPPAAPPP